MSVKVMIFEVRDDGLVEIDLQDFSRSWFSETWLGATKRHNGWYFLLDLETHTEPTGPFLGKLGAEMAATVTYNRLTGSVEP